MYVLGLSLPFCIVWSFSSSLASSGSFLCPQVSHFVFLFRLELFCLQEVSVSVSLSLGSFFARLACLLVFETGSHIALDGLELAM